VKSNKKFIEVAAWPLKWAWGYVKWFLIWLLHKMGH